jgi:hypothetical protein
VIHEVPILVLTRTDLHLWIHFYAEYVSVISWIHGHYRRFKYTHERGISIAAKALKAKKLRRAWE